MCSRSFDLHECVPPPLTHNVSPPLAPSLPLCLSSYLAFEITLPLSRRRCTGHIIVDCFGVCTQRNWCLASIRVTTRCIKRVLCCGEIKFYRREIQRAVKELCEELCCSTKEEKEEEEPEDIVQGHGEYDVEIKNALDARYDAAIKELVRRIDSLQLFHSAPHSLPIIG